MKAPDERGRPSGKGALSTNIATNDDQSVNPEPVDPFDTDRLRSKSIDDIGVSRVMLTVPVRKPSRTEFFRVHPDSDMTVDWWVVERESEGDREVYWITEQYRAELLDEARHVRLFVCINKHATTFLWPAKLPSPDSSIGRQWAESALQIAEAATTCWVKMVGKKTLGAYELFKARGDLGEPEWPDKSLKELLRLAFKGDRLIDRDDHPVLRELAGEL